MPKLVATLSLVLLGAIVGVACAAPVTPPHPSPSYPHAGSGQTFGGGGKGHL